jgi:hypothetical protein
MFRFLQRLENFERNYPRIFWFCTSLLGFFLFHEPVQNSSQSQVVIEQVRGGARDSEKINSFVLPQKPERPRTGQQDPSKSVRPGPKQLDDPKPNSGIKRAATGGGGSGSGGGGGNSWEDENAVPKESD